MPISLVAAREDVQLKYFGERVDPASIAAFHFTKNKNKPKPSLI